MAEVTSPSGHIPGQRSRTIVSESGHGPALEEGLFPHPGTGQTATATQLGHPEFSFDYNDFDYIYSISTVPYVILDLANGCRESRVL
jgi:hypothetical protein